MQMKICFMQVFFYSILTTKLHDSYLACTDCSGNLFIMLLLHY